MKLNIEKIREDFPILKQKVYNRPLVYFDNAATTQKPQAVIDSISNYYKTYNSNIHRGVHHLSQLATAAFEEARDTARKFINAQNKHEIIFTRGTTEAINLVACSFGRGFLNKGDEIIVSEMEHHSNIVPWQLVCEEKNASLKVIPVTDEGELELSAFDKLITPKTKLVAITHISNVLGTINPVKQIISTAHKHNVPVLIDGAQATAHHKVDVQELDCDFYCFSGHKMLGPTGVGVLYGKEEWLNKMPPYQGGGEMIKRVTFEKTTYNKLPYKFEAGTPDIAGAIGLQAAINYIVNTGIENISKYESELLEYATQKLSQIEGLKIYGTSENKAGVISFNIKSVHHSDMGTIIDKLGVAVRTGHHCADTLMDRFKIDGTLRASFSFYNTREEIDTFIDAVNKAKSMLV